MKKLLVLLVISSVASAQIYYNKSTISPTGTHTGLGQQQTITYQGSPDFAFDFIGQALNSSSTWHLLNGYSAYLNQSGSDHTVAVFGQGESSGAASHVWGGNLVSVGSASGASAIGLEIDADALNAGASVYGLVLVGVGTSQPVNAIQVQANNAASPFQDGIVFNYGGGLQPISGALIKTNGASLNADYGINLGGTYNVAELSVPSFGVAATPGSINSKVLVTGSASAAPIVAAASAGGGATDIDLQLKALGAGTVKVGVLPAGSNVQIGNSTGTVTVSGPMTAGKIGATTLTSVPTAIPTTDAGNVPFTLISGGVPFIFNSCTLSGTGAISACATMPLTYANAYMFFNANILAPSGNGSAAGFYYVQMSSTTAGQVCTTGGLFTLYSSGSPTIPASCVAPGSGVSTPNTIPATIMQGPTATLAAHSMGKNGSVECDTAVSQTSSANTRTLTTKFGATNITIAPTTAVTFVDVAKIVNAGSESAQSQNHFGNNATTLGLFTTAVTRGTVDTGSNVTISWNETMNTNTEFAVLERYACKVWPN